MSPKIECPDPLVRAPRALRDGRTPDTRLVLAPPALQGAIVAILCRDTRGFDLTDAQRLTHFPASPMVSLSWFQGLDAGLVERTARSGGRSARRSCWLAANRGPP
jgi:hypothetical protein